MNELVGTICVYGDEKKMKKKMRNGKCYLWGCFNAHTHRIEMRNQKNVHHFSVAILRNSHLGFAFGNYTGLKFELKLHVVTIIYF